MKPSTLLAALVFFFLTLPALLLAGEHPALVPMERDSTLDTLPFGAGEIKKAAPVEQRVGIKKEAMPASTLGKKDPLITIETPVKGVVTRSFQKVTGRVGGGITKAFIRINDDTQVVTVKDGSFEAYAALKPGLNGMTALAWDLEGNIGKDSLSVLYTPNAVGPVVSLVNPKDGAYFDITENRVITVTAKSDKDVTEGYLVLNNVPRRVRFQGGLMKQELALFPGTNELFVEAFAPDGRAGRSKAVKIRTFDARPRDIVAVLTWDSDTADFDLHVWDSFGHHTFNEAPDPALSDAAIPGGELDMDRKGGYGPEVFSLDTASPEVYTFYCRYNPGLKEISASCYLRLLLYGDEPSRRIMRSFGPMRLDAARPVWEAASVKMPEGVFFDEKNADLQKTLGMDVKAVKRLARMVEEENEAFKLLAISAMGQIKSEEAVSPLLNALAADSPEIRCAAAGALYNIKSVKAVDGLVMALKDEDKDVRAAAAGALGNIGDLRALGPLTELLEKESALSARVKTIRALGRLGDVGSLSAIVSQAGDKEPSVRVEAVRAIAGLARSEVSGQVEGKGQSERVEGETPTQRVDPPHTLNADFLIKAGLVLTEALKDKEDGVRMAAASAVGQLGSKKYSKALMDLLHFDGSEGVRVQAAMALGRLKDEAALEELRYVAGKDPSDKVRFCSRKAIEDMTEPNETRDEPPPIKLDEDVVIY